MKKVTLLTIASFLLIHFSQAQITKGTTFLGGSLGYAHSENLNNGQAQQKQNTVTLFPVAGKAIKDNLVAGLGLIYTNNTVKGSPQSGEPYVRSFGGSVFVRRYKSLGSRFYVFGEGALDVIHNKSLSTSGIDYSVYSKGISTDLGVHPGVSYAVSKHLQLETALGNLFSISYAHNRVTQSTIGGVTTTTQNNFSINTSFSNFTNFYLGFRVFL